MARRKPGVTLSERLTLELEAAGESVNGGVSLVERWTWELGSPVGDHDPGHVDIAISGHTFTGAGLEGDDLDIRSWDSSQWPYVEIRAINDHAGCVCWKQPVIGPPA